MVLVIVVSLALIAAVLVLGRLRVVPSPVVRVLAVAGGTYILVATLLRVRVSVDSPGFAVCLAAVLLIGVAAASLLFRGLRPRRTTPTP